MSSNHGRLSQAVMDGNADKAVQLVQRALDKEMGPQEILDNGLVPGMNEVGVRFKRGDMFVPEVLMAADAMHAGLTLLRPHLVATGAKMAGKIVLGTVQGDLHDIGKNLVGMMCEGAGFEVINLGFNVKPAAFVAAVKEHEPDIVGMSALLTTTMRTMSHTIRALEEAGLRDRVKIMVGGAPVDRDFAERIGADGYGSNGPTGADLAKAFMGTA